MNSTALEHQCHPGTGSFVGSVAVEDDLAISGYLAVSFVDLLQADDLSPHDLLGIGVDRESIPQIEESHRFACIEHAFEFGRIDARCSQTRDEAPTKFELPQQVRRRNADRENE